MFVIVKQQNPGSSIVCRFYPFFWHTEVFLDCVTYDSSANIRQARPVPSVSDCFCQHYFSKLNCISISTTISSLWIEWGIELCCISSKSSALSNLNINSRMAKKYVFWENRRIIKKFHNSCDLGWVNVLSNDLSPACWLAPLFSGVNPSSLLTCGPHVSAFLSP